MAGKGRKTIMVDAVRERANSLLSIPELSQDEKKGVCHILESVLNDTDNYRGYMYSDSAYDCGLVEAVESRGLANPDREYDRRYF